MTRRSPEPNYYQVLRIEPETAHAQIKRAFRREIRIWHPDVNGGSAEATAQTILINRAYEILSDPKKRADYDDRHPQWRGKARGRQADAADPERAARDAERRRRQEDEARWRSQPEPELARSDSAFTQGHWYAHPKKGQYRVIEVADGRVRVRFRNGEFTKFVSDKLWSAWEEYLGRGGQTSSDAHVGASAKEKNWQHRTPERDRGEAAQRVRGEAAAHESREVREQARRGGEESNWEGVLRRLRQEAQERYRRAAEAREKRQAEELARKLAAQWLQLEARKRERQEAGKKHRHDLVLHRAREAAERERHGSGRNAECEDKRVCPVRDDPLGWSDTTFVIGHWYAQDNSVYEVVAIRDGIVNVRYRDGREEPVLAQSLWDSWQRVREQQSAKGRSVRIDIVGETRRIAEQGDMKRVAQYLAQVDWVRLVDKRAERGPLYIVPHEEKRDEIDSLFNEFKRRGLPLTYAKGGGGVSDGQPAWFTR
ncbi:MAG: DnaJ domain-containing protein [Dehalococcoidia bacterium]